jgi:hypothetical protein
MAPKTNWIELSALCVLFILLSVVGIVWNITSGLLTSGIDGIMLLFICLMMGGIFSLMLVVMLWPAGLIPAFKQTKAARAVAAGAVIPAKAAAAGDIPSATQAENQESKTPGAKPAPAKPTPPASPTPAAK